MDALPHERAIAVWELACVFKGEVCTRYAPDETDQSYNRHLEWCHDLQMRMARCCIVRPAPMHINFQFLQVDVMTASALSAVNKTTYRQIYNLFNQAVQICHSCPELSEQVAKWMRTRDEAEKVFYRFEPYWWRVSLPMRLLHHIKPYHIRLISL